MPSRLAGALVIKDEDMSLRPARANHSHAFLDFGCLTHRVRRRPDSARLESSVTASPPVRVVATGGMMRGVPNLSRAVAGWRRDAREYR